MTRRPRSALVSWAFALVVLAAATPAFERPAGAAGKASPLLQTVADTEVDWEAGSVTARAGAAADLRLPGPDAARPAARRAAEQRAVVRLTQALEALPLAGTRHLSPQVIAAVVGRAKARDIDYQSNGGVMLSLGVDFADLATETEKSAPAAPAAPVAKPARPGHAPAQGKIAATKVPDLERAPAPGKPREAHPEGVASGAVVPELLLSVASMPLELAPRLLVGGVEKSLGSAVYRLGEAPRARKAHPAKRDKSGRLVVSLPPDEAERAEGAHAIIYVRSVTKR
jgi:hypothetical protein